MKKTFIIAMCCIVALMSACKKKPVEPTPDPEPVNYAEQYVGDYLGNFAFTILTLNNEAVTNMTFPIENIGMNISKGETLNAITATVTVDDETRQTTGTATEEKAGFETVHLFIDKPDQFYRFELDLTMEGIKAGDTLNITGSFTGNGQASIMGIEQVFDEVSGTLIGSLVAQPMDVDRK